MVGTEDQETGRMKGGPDLRLESKKQGHEGLKNKGRGKEQKKRRGPGLRAKIKREEKGKGERPDRLRGKKMQWLSVKEIRMKNPLAQ